MPLKRFINYSLNINHMNLQETLNKIKKELLILLKVNIEFRHIGSSALGIDGKKDIDLEVLVNPADFKTSKQKMISKYGLPKKEIDEFWNKFETKIGDWEIDLLLSTPNHPATITNKIFFEHLKNNVDSRNEYLKIKNKSKLLPREQYNKAKEEFRERVVKEVQDAQNNSS